MEGLNLLKCGMQGRSQKFFEGGFEIILYGKKNLGGFSDFFSQKTLAN